MLDAHLTQEQADEYAIGSLEPELQRIIALHLAECVPCRDVVHESERLAAHIALVSPRATPRRALRNRVFTTAGITRPSWPVRAFGYARTAAGIAAVIVAIASFTGMMTVRGQISDLRAENALMQSQVTDALSAKFEVAVLRTQLQDQQQIAAELKRQYGNDRDLVIALSSEKTQLGNVLSTDEDHGAIGRLIWDPEQERLWFVAKQLGAPPSGQTYQIWVNSGGRYVSLGTFHPDAAGFARHETTMPGGLEAYESAIVTIEPAGGVAERTGPPVFVASLETLRR